MKKATRAKFVLCDKCKAHGRIELGEVGSSREFCTKEAGLRLAVGHSGAGHMTLLAAQNVMKEIRKSPLPEDGDDPSLKAVKCKHFVEKVFELLDAMGLSKKGVH